MRLKKPKCCASRVEKYVVARAERKRIKTRRAAVNSSQAFVKKKASGKIGRALL